MRIPWKRLREMMAMAVLLVLSAAPAGADGTSGGDKAASVNGTVISMEDFEREVQTMVDRFADLGQIPNEAQLAELREAVLEKMIETTLLFQKAQEAGFAVSDRTLDEEMKVIRSGFPTEEQFMQSLGTMKLTEASLKSQVRQELTIEKFLEEKFARAVEISTAQIETFYQANQDKFRQPEAVRARHILLAVAAGTDEQTRRAARQRLENLRQQVLSGGDFAELAKQHSNCPSAQAGGDLGFFSPGQMLPAFEKAAFALEPGQLSSVVETRFGFHLIRVEERKKPEGMIPLSEAEGEIREFLQQQKLKEQVEAYLAGVRKNSEVKIFIHDSSPYCIWR